MRDVRAVTPRSNGRGTRHFTPYSLPSRPRLPVRGTRAEAPPAVNGSAVPARLPPRHPRDKEKNRVAYFRLLYLPDRLRAHGPCDLTAARSATPTPATCKNVRPSPFFPPLTLSLGSGATRPSSRVALPQGAGAELGGPALPPRGGAAPPSCRPAGRARSGPPRLRYTARAPGPAGVGS